MKILRNIYLACFTLIVSIIVFGYALFRYETLAVGSDDTLKEITIEPGGISDIATTLYKNNLIKNKKVFVIYVYLSGKTNLKAATYYLSEDMNVEEIVNILYEGGSSNLNQISITFNEGLNMRGIVKIITQNTDINEEDIYNLLKNKTYLNSLINEYWFLTEDILNNDIYYSLEGYLYPNTYYFSKDNLDAETVLETMLNEMDKQLTNYKDELEAQTMSIHQILTLASIVELEGTTTEDRKGIAGVFLNRLESGMNLGSDVTTYYGAKIDVGERDLTSDEIAECNNYNTRCANFVELPVSPICNPSIESITAILEPTESNYYYFVADKNKTIYFSKNITEHNNTIATLKSNDLWYEY